MDIPYRDNLTTDYLLAGLNSEQAKAVRHVDGPLLILAGAGSGKTRVLVHRIAYLILEAGVPPWAILGITFTNKAASEMKSRVDAFLPDESASIWISTFHSACVRILRRDIERVGYSRYFTIADGDDQLSLVKECIKELNYSDKQYAPKAVAEQIGRAKDELLTPGEYTQLYAGDAYREKIARVYSLYQKKLVKQNALDFDDIILATIKLFRECRDVLEYYRNRFVHVLVDEYQDTNKAQYELISMISGKWKNLCVVGDDDQSIYSWRGANIGNILSFEKENRNAEVIKLEQNYRSTKVILSAANMVINKNTKRKAKRLWTDNADGGAICCVNVDNEHEEAALIARSIKKLRAEQGVGYNEIAILYRINAQSRVLENMFARESVPYRIIGGFKFFDRKEIKDIIAYLRILQNHSDDLSFKRIINVPRRGIGAVTVEKLEDRAAEFGISIFDAAAAALDEPRQFPELKTASVKFGGFVDLIQGLTRDTQNLAIAEILDLVLVRSGILAMYEADKSDDGRARLENILEFRSEIKEFENNFVGDGIFFNETDDDAAQPYIKPRATLSEFLMHVSLISDVDGYDEEDDRVSMMTMHSAKGLEYDAVFIAGAEEGIFPGFRSIDDREKMEEERRLCYVAITRAKKNLFITHAASRTLFGNTTYNRLSRFISDIPKNLLTDRYPFEADNRYKPKFSVFDKNRPTGRGGVKTLGTADIKPNGTPFGRNPAEIHMPPASRDGADLSGEYENERTYSVGDAVGHKKYGSGVVTNRYRDKNDYIIEIEFIDAGLKRFIESMVKLRLEGGA